MARTNNQPQTPTDDVTSPPSDTAGPALDAPQPSLDLQIAEREAALAADRAALAKLEEAEAAMRRLQEESKRLREVAEAAERTRKILRIKQAMADGRAFEVVEPFKGTSLGDPKRFEPGPLDSPCDDILEAVEKGFVRAAGL